MFNRRNFIKSAGVIALTTGLAPSLTAQDLEIESIKIKPPKLKKGDTVAITSPAGAVWDDSQISVFSNILENLGFKVVLGKTLTLKYGYFAGTDLERANELNSFFADNSIKGIFCMKGGWGCARLLDKLDYSLIKKNPKILIGFSDITSLLLAITHKTGLVTFHGPVGNSGWNEFTRNVFEEVLQNIKPITYPINPINEEPILTLTSGNAKGELIGGNLSVLCAIIGSNYLANWDNKILFIEDSHEEPYSIDRMLTQLKLNGAFEKLNGIVIGKCAKCVAEEPAKSFTLQQVLELHFKNIHIPVFYGAMIGHIENKLTVPLGIQAAIDADRGSIQLLENSVI